jgi:hypothetical protein
VEIVGVEDFGITEGADKGGKMLVLRRGS